MSIQTGYMQKTVPFKWIILGLAVAAIVIVTVLAVTVPSVGAFIMEGLAGIGGTLYSGIVCCALELRFWIGALGVALIAGLYMTRAYWHKKKVAIVAAAPGGLQTGLTGGSMYNTAAAAPSNVQIIPETKTE